MITHEIDNVGNDGERKEARRCQKGSGNRAANHGNQQEIGDRTFGGKGETIVREGWQNSFCHGVQATGKRARFLVKYSVGQKAEARAES